MRWLKIKDGIYVNLDHASNVELGMEADFSVVVEPGSERPRRSVLRIYFAVEVDSQQMSVPVYDPQVIDEVLGMMESMSHDTSANFKPKSRRSPGIKQKGEPLVLEPTDGLLPLAKPRTGKGS